MKKILLICAVFIFMCGWSFCGKALEPCEKEQYNFATKSMSTLDDIKLKCFFHNSLTVFVVSEGLSYQELGKSLGARPYMIGVGEKKEYYIKKNYNNISEIVVTSEKYVGDFFVNFGKTPFIKKFDVYFVSCDKETCVKTMERLNPLIKGNVIPKYEFLKMDIIMYNLPKLKKSPKIFDETDSENYFIAEYKFDSRSVDPKLKYKCQTPSQLRWVIRYERVNTETMQ
ncbi:MAG: hypothetical protein ACI4PR_00095 [Acutalibacteraceae bacterium]